MMKFLEAANLFRDCWKLYRQYFAKDMSSVDWDKLADETHKIYEKYRKETFAKDLLVVTINEIERGCKDRR